MSQYDTTTKLVPTDVLKAKAAAHLFGNYGERAIALVRGEGARVWDYDGREYLDFLAGISVCSLGHAHPAVGDAIVRQARELIHCSNLYIIPEQVELARRLCQHTFAERVFFANSGAEVNEAAVKLARLYSKNLHGEGRHEVITFRNSFHGRTIAMISASGQEKIQRGYEPLLEGFKYAEFNSLESAAALVSKSTCAIMVEPVQGEGGVVPADAEFLKGLRQLCTEAGLLLIFDEIQCGMGRCGRLFAHQVYGVEPDLMTSAKALGNGVPIGALLAHAEIAEHMKPGTHGSTFGGGPLACAAALAVLETMEREDIPARAVALGKFFRHALQSRLSGHPGLKEVRGLGLMVGVVLTFPGASVQKRCLELGLLINCTMERVLRILPPLIVTEEQCDHAANIIRQAVVEGWEKFQRESTGVMPAASESRGGSAPA